MNGSNAVCEVLIALARHQKASIFDHIAKLDLGGELCNALDEVLVAVAIAGNKLADERDSAEAPALVDGVEQGVVDFGKLEAGEYAAGLEHAVGFFQRDVFVREVADAKGDGVEVDAVGGDHVEVLGIGFYEVQARGSCVWCLEGALLAFCKHVWVDVGDCDFGVGVVVDGRGVIEHAEGDVTGSAGDIEDVPALLRRRR